MTHQSLLHIAGERGDGSCSQEPRRPAPSTVPLLDQVVRVADESITRAGLAGAVWQMPSPSDFPEGVWDAGYRRSTTGPAALVRSALCEHEVDATHFRVLSDDQAEHDAATDEYSHIVVRPGPLTALTLLHQTAHVVNRAGGGDGHDSQFVLIATELYRTYLGAPAAEQFQLVTTLHPDARELRNDLRASAPTGRGIGMVG